MLRTLSESGPLGLNEISLRTGVAKSTAFRVMTTLRQLGYIVRDEGRNYCIGPNLAALVNEESSHDVLRRIALPYMLRLRDRVGETVNLGVLQVDKITYLEVVPSEFALRLSERPGAVVAAHSSALGKAILANSPPHVVESLVRGRKLERITRNTITDQAKFREELQRVKERGIAYDRGESSLLATCIGAAIVGPRGMAIGAISISGPALRFHPKRGSAAVEALIETVKAVSRELSNAAEAGSSPAYASQ